VPVQPADGATLWPTDVTFSWAAYGAGGTQASEYVIDIDPMSGTTHNPAAVTTAGTRWAPTTLLPTGAYSWNVKAYDAAGGLIGSVTAPRTFYVDGAITAVSPVFISAQDGTAVGKTLVSTPAVWSPADVSVTYQWLRNGSTISGAITPTYTLTVADFGKDLSLRVTAKRAGFTDGMSVSNTLTGTAGGALVATTAPLVSGTAMSGSALHVSQGTWSNRHRASSMSGIATEPRSPAPRAVPIGSLPTTRERMCPPLSSRPRPGSRRDRPPQDGVKTIKTFTIDPFRKGAMTIKLATKKLKPGRHKIKLVYMGNASAETSKAKVIRLIVYR
jgi:hypothetical protein